MAHATVSSQFLKHAYYASCLLTMHIFQQVILTQQSTPPPFQSTVVKIEIQKTVQFPVPQSVPHTRQKAETLHKLEGE